MAALLGSTAVHTGVLPFDPTLVSAGRAAQTRCNLATAAPVAAAHAGAVLADTTWSKAEPLVSVELSPSIV